jgi:hypothetical protein
MELVQSSVVPRTPAPVVAPCRTWMGGGAARASTAGGLLSFDVGGESSKMGVEPNRALPVLHSASDSSVDGGAT